MAKVIIENLKKNSEVQFLYNNGNIKQANITRGLFYHHLLISTMTPLSSICLLDCLFLTFTQPQITVINPEKHKLLGSLVQNKQI